MKIKYLFFLFFCFFHFTTSAQVEFVDVKASTYKVLPKEDIFIHYNTNFLIPGQKLLYKVYCVNKETNLLSNMSKIVYVELVDENLKTIYKDKVKLYQGAGQGDMFLTTNLKSGNYKLVAYTKWMKNTNSFFEDDIFLINPYTQKITIQNDSITHNNSYSFNNNTETNEISLNKQVYKKREKVELKINAKQFYQGNYSISVRKKTNHNFKLKKNSQNYSLSKNKLQESSNNNQITLPDFRGELIVGKIIKDNSESNFQNHQVALSFVGKQGFYKIAKTNKKGMFFFNLLEENYPEKAYLQILNNKDSLQLEILDSKAINLSNLTFRKIQTNKVLDSIINQYSIYNQIQNAYLEKNSDSITYRKDNRKLFLNDFTTYKLDDYTRFNSIEKTMIEVVDIASIVKENREFKFKILSKDLEFDTNHYPTLLIVDGFIVRNHEDIMSIKTNIIEKILVSQRNYQLASNYYTGIIYIKTFKGNYLPKLQKDISTINIKPLEPIKKYHFQAHNIKTKRIPDYRLQLLWLPTATKLNKTISFYTSDVNGIYEIEIQGFNNQGLPVFLRKSFKVN